MPASRARMRVSALLRDTRSLHQSGIDVPVNFAVRINNLLGIILADDWDGLLLALQRLKTKAGIGLRCVGDGLLSHRPHRVHLEHPSRFLRNASRRLFGGGLRRFFDGHLCRLFVDLRCGLSRSHGRSLFCDRFHRLIGGDRCGLLRDHLDHVVGVFLIVAGQIQSRRSQPLRTKSCAGTDKKQCSCECPEGRSFPHEREVMPGIAPSGKLFFRISWGSTPPKNRSGGISCPSCPRGSFRLSSPENNPVQIGTEERLFRRAGSQCGDACAERIDFPPSRA